MRDRARADSNDADGPHGPRRSVDAHQPPGGGVLRDSYGRVADDLRISITDRCNFRCIYCMPAEGLKWLNREDLLRFEEITRLARILSSGTVCARSASPVASRSCASRSRSWSG